MTYKEYVEKHLQAWYSVSGHELCDLELQDDGENFISTNVQDSEYNDHEIDYYICNLCKANKEITDPKKHWEENHKGD